MDLQNAEGKGLNELVDKGLSGMTREVGYNVRTSLICSSAPW